jgi:hypothetical protein
MTSIATIRQEMHGFIDIMPERKLYALKSLFEVLNDDEPLIIETDLTDEERAIIAEGEAEYERDPSSFTSLRDYLAGK